MSEPSRLRVSSIADLVQLVPYLVGFTPHQSLVVVVEEQRQVVVTARADLAAATKPGEAEGLIAKIWDRYPQANAFLFAYTDDRIVGWSVIDRCVAALPPGATHTSGLVDADELVLTDGQVKPIDRYGSAAIDAVVAGMSPAASREDLMVGLASAPESPELNTAVVEAIAKLRPPETASSDDLVDRAHVLMDQMLSGVAPELATERAIQLAALVKDDAVQNLALLSLQPKSADDHLKMWQGVVNRTPGYMAEVPLYLAGMAAWVLGDGARALIAAEQSLKSASSTAEGRPADLIMALVDTVTPPSEWGAIREHGLTRASEPVQRILRPNQRRRWATVDPPSRHIPEASTPPQPSTGIPI